MKIVVVASLAYSLVNLRGRLLAEMVARGNEVIACAPDDDAEVIAALAGMGIAYTQIPMDRVGLSPVADLRTLISLIAVFARERPDVVLAYTQKPIIYAGIASQFTRRVRFFPMVSGLGHAFSDGGGRWLKRLVAGLYRLALVRAQTVFVFNRDDEPEMRHNRMMRKTLPVIQLPGSGVDLDHYAAAPVPQGPLRFIMIARLLRSKGLVEYSEAARRIRATHPDVRFALLGPLDPGPEGVGQDAIESWQREGVVDYLGAVRDVRPHLCAASVFVLPSWYREGLPRTILEAMATGRAVITTDMPGCREPVKPGISGFVVEPRSDAALEAAMMEFVREPSLAAKMGEAGRRLVADYSVDRVNDLVITTMQPSAPGGIDRARRAAPGRTGSSTTSIGARFRDVVCAATGLVLAAPLLLMLWLLVWMLDGKPVLFMQTRCGLGGAPFRLVKFRTMTPLPDAEDQTALGSPALDVQRITRLGRWLRASRLDELPQLWNVLVGDMSLVGPRPLLPATIEAAGDAGVTRCSVRPGLTGWAQISGNALLNDSDKIALDEWYVGHRSFRLDLVIMARTALVVLLGERIDLQAIGAAHARSTHRSG
jgi:lipopolysaccharide/colanic/teichoic acid biosynthesis glycosyltransferase/glycosyltransferase involved in cell wall biosynthesis